MSKLESSIIYDITPQRQLQYQYHKNGWFMVWPLIYQQLYTSKLDWTLIKGDYTKAWKLYFLFLFTGKQDNMANGQRNIYSERWNNIDHKFNETNYL